MNKYIVKTKQNLYDISVAIYGSVEGIFDLFVSNPDISFETVLTKGMVLNYHSDFMLNKDIANWLDKNGVTVRNGNFKPQTKDIKSAIKEWIAKANSSQLTFSSVDLEAGWNKPKLWNETKSDIATASDESPQVQIVNRYWLNITIPSNKEEQEPFYNDMATPKIKIIQTGKSSVISMQIPTGKFVCVDWGDESDINFYRNESKATKATHTYMDDGEHTIIIYGCSTFVSLDFSDVNGIYYALTEIFVQKQFITPYPNNSTLNKLFTVLSDEQKH